MQALIKASVVLLLLRAVMAGCQNSGKGITKEQLSKVTDAITYEEVISLLGPGKDIGSGLYVIQYEYTDGQQLTLNFPSYDGTITEEDYEEIRELIRE